MKIIIFDDHSGWAVPKLMSYIIKYNTDIEFTKLYVWAEPEEILELVKKDGIDLLHFPFWQPFVKAINKLPKLAELPHIVSAHHFTYYSDLLGKCSKVIVASCIETAEYLKAKEYKGRMKIIPYGIDTENFKPAYSNFREKYGIPQDVILIGWFGHFLERKRLDLLFTAFRNLKEKYNIHLLLVGDEQDKRQVWRNFGSLLPVSSYTKLERIPDDEMCNAYNSLDIYCSTSDCEGGAIPAMEAMSCDIPVVATKTGIVGEIIENGKNGLVVPKGDLKGIQSSLKRYICNKRFALKCAKKGREIIQDYSKTMFASEYRKIYIETLAKGE